MRIPPAKYALVVLLAALVGCKSGESTFSPPTASLSKLNPFSSSAKKADYPVKPSALANATPVSPGEAGYASTNSSAAGAQQASTAPTGVYPGSQQRYPSASSSSLATAPKASSTATTPQSGLYSSQTDRTASVPAGGSGYSWDTGTGSSDPSTPSRYATTTPGYQNTALGGVYDQATPTAPRYSIPSDRYGYNADAGASTSQASPAYSPYGTAGGQTPDYESAASTGSGYADRYGTPPSAGGTAPASTSDNRYAWGDPAASGGSSGYRNGEPTEAPSYRDWNPGAPTANAPGNTGYQPGTTAYQPGTTGYTPPGVSPYGTPTTGYPPAASSGTSATPYLPGSTKLYEPRNASASSASASSFPVPLPATDSQVMPAGHTPESAPPQSYLR